jgi:methionyl-tRNA synthetase
MSVVGTGLDPLKYPPGHEPRLRQYPAAKLNARKRGTSTNADAPGNSDPIGKYVNTASRAAGFISKRRPAVRGTSDGAVLLGCANRHHRAVL